MLVQRTQWGWASAHHPSVAVKRLLLLSSLPVILGLLQVVRRVRSSVQGRGAPPLQLLQQAIADHGPLLAEAEVDALLHQLWELKQGLQEKQREASMELLLHFLQNSRWGHGVGPPPREAGSWSLQALSPLKPVEGCCRHASPDECAVHTCVAAKGWRGGMWRLMHWRTPWL